VVTDSGVTGTPSLQLPMEVCWAVPPRAYWQLVPRTAQSRSPSPNFQKPYQSRASRTLALVLLVGARWSAVRLGDPWASLDIHT
jgi:hypothetical protein